MSYRGKLTFWGSAEWAAICKGCGKWGNVYGLRNGDEARLWASMNLMENGWREYYGNWICADCQRLSRLTIDLLVIGEGLGL